MRRRIAFVLLALSITLAGCTGGGSDADDSDSDGLLDSTEREGRVITLQLLDGPTSRSVTSDPELADTDGDGLGDAEEMLARGTDPRSVDSDEDGLLDGGDLRAPDEDTANAWRRMGIVETDGIFRGELDACPEGGFQLKPTHASSDLPLPDGLSDGEEVRGWDIVVRSAVRRVTSDPCVADTDGDGLQDHDEKRLLTDPRMADTDNDGVRDGNDADPLFDLALGFSNFTFEVANRTSVRLVFSAGHATASLVAPGNGTATLDVPDVVVSRDALEVSVIVVAEDLSTGESVRIFPDPRGAILTFDLLAGTAGGAETAPGEPHILRVSGADGSASFRWETVRR